MRTDEWGEPRKVESVLFFSYLPFFRRIPQTGNFQRLLTVFPFHNNNQGGTNCAQTGRNRSKWNVSDSHLTFSGLESRASYLDKEWRRIDLNGLC